MIRRARHLASRFLNGTSGSVAVEFAMIAPVFLLTLAGIVDIGSAMTTKLSQNARITAAADYALLQSAPGDAAEARTLAQRLAGLVREDGAQRGRVVVNNAASAEWDGGLVSTSTGPGNASAFYCPALTDQGYSWGASVASGTKCAAGGTAGQFIEISASLEHVAIFPIHSFMDGNRITARSLVRLP